MKVQNMTSNKGTAVPDQFILTDDYGNRFFQSYDSIIVKIGTQCSDCLNLGYCDKDCPPNIYLDSKYWNYSITTSKYRNIFLGEGIEETRKKIKSGEYILTDLN